MAITVRPSWDFQPEQARNDALRAVQDEDAGRVRHRRPQPRGPGGGCAGWPTCARPRRPSLGHITRLIPYRRADTLALDEMTRRSLELVAHAPRRQARGLAAERDRLLGDADGGAAAVGMAHVAADVDRADRRTARRRRGAFQPVGPARRSEEPARPVVRPGAAGGAGRNRPGDAPRPGRAGQDPRASCPSSRPGSPRGSRSGSTSSRRPSSSARRSGRRSRPLWSTTRRWRSRKGA